MTRSRTNAAKTAVITLIMLLAGLLPATVQSAEETAGAKEPARNAVFGELLGQSVGLGVYYERMVSDNFAARAGVSTLIVGYGIPLGVSYLSSGNHKFELGGGATYLEITDWVGMHRGLIGSANIGYRYQREQPGFMMRAAYTPLFGREGVVSLVGISLGRAF
ncbi:MAG: hypothetical protein FIA91_08795 [Geobacter sp.]|nr:hypothetical protein [Geobacter sp.]